MKYSLVNLGQIEALFNKLGGVEGARRFLSGELVVVEADKPTPQTSPAPIITSLPEIIFLPVDYNMSLDQMIAAGKYDWKNSDLNAKNFPITGEGIQEFELELVHPNCNISSENATKEMEKDSDPENPWFAAKTEHLLAFGAAFPELQRKFPIVALGSVAEIPGGLRVPCLHGDDSQRFLYHLCCSGDVFASCHRFLRVRRKVSGPVTSSPSA